MSQVSPRNRLLFLWLCAACVAAVVAFGVITRKRIAQQAELPAAPLSAVNPSLDPSLDTGPAIPQAPAQPTRPEQPPAAKAANKWVYFRRDSVAETQGKLGETLGQVSRAPLDSGFRVLPTEVQSAENLTCARLHFANGKGVCVIKNASASAPGMSVGNALHAWFESFVGYAAVMFDEHFERGWSVPLDGLPSRVRMSPSGKLAAVTVFVSGESYSSLRFSTRTIVIDVASGKPIVDLEKFAVTRHGEPFQSPDFNFWGVTFARDDHRLYATLWTQGKTYLIEGNLAARTANVIYEDLECPSLSPDGTRVAFKKRHEAVGIATTWRLSVLDLKTLTEKPLTETRSVDDQAEWLDQHQLLYALPRPDGGNDIWMQTDDTGAPPRLWLPNASSPAVVTARSQ